jgi:uncharacterized paraquat-inducible protein A
MAKKRIVRAYYRNQRTTLQYKFLRCPECDALLVTLGPIKSEMVRCPECNLGWSISRFGLILVGETYYVKEE